MKRILIAILAVGLMLQAAHAEEMDRDKDKKGQQRREEQREDRESRQRDGEKKPLVVIRKDKGKEKPD